MNTIGIIIPIYNVGSYLRECLNSVLNQSLTDFCALLIDDGSTDNSAEICLDFCNRDNRFIYHYQKNAGVSSARNFGIEYFTNVVKVKRISMIDSDDIIHIDYLKILSETMDKYNVLVASCELKTFRKFVDIGQDTLVSNKSNVLHFPFNYNSLQFGIWRFMYDSSIFNSKIELRFNNQLKYGEDYLFLAELLLNVDKYAITDAQLYYYRNNPSSAISSGNIKKICEDRFLMYEMLKKKYFSSNKAAKRMILQLIILKKRI